MSNKKLLTTSKLIDSITLRASIPSTQNTFEEKDFLYFINEEMDLGVVPHIVMHHEDYFLYSEFVDIEPGVDRYSIPNRAIGTKLRDLAYCTGPDSYSEMTRIKVEDLADYERGYFTNNQFYIEGDDIVISKDLTSGKLKLSYYIRPNALVSEDDVASVVAINKNNGIITVDKFPEAFGSASLYDIVSSKSSFRLVGKDLLPDGAPSSTNLTYTFGTKRVANYTFTSIPSGSYLTVIDSSQAAPTINIFWFDLTGTDPAPSVFGNLYRVDLSASLNLAQSLSILSSTFNLAFTDSRLIMSVLSSTSVELTNGGPGISVGPNFLVTYSSTMVETIVSVGTVTIPKKLSVGDVFSLPEQTSIPQIPIELHSMLAQRAAMRCLESLNDTAGLQAAAAKLADMEAKTSSLINNRVESAPLKIRPRHTPIKRSALSSHRRGR